MGKKKEAAALFIRLPSLAQKKGHNINLRDLEF